MRNVTRPGAAAALGLAQAGASAALAEYAMSHVAPHPA